MTHETSRNLPATWLLAVFLALAGASISADPAHAVSANPNAIAVTQPDGTRILLRMFGDERFHWEEDLQGYTVLRSQGRYVYARRGPSGNLVPSDLEVGKANPRAVGLAKRILPDRALIARARASGPGGSESQSIEAPEQVSPTGNVLNLVIPIRFSNHTGRTLPSEANLDTLFNAVGGDPVLAPTGSIRDVYLANSYGAMTLNSVVADWTDVSNSEQYYANGASGDQTLHQALIQALNAVDAYVDFSQYDQDGDGYIDSIAFLHSGYGAEWGGNDADGTFYTNRIWSHRWVIWDTNGDGQYTPQDGEWTSNEGVKVWDYHISPALWSTSGSAIGRIGVIAHETGHFFGLPDLYDPDSSAGEGIGSYGMMANSWGFDFSQRYPPHFSPWSKVELGWSNPTVISLPGQYSLNAAEDFNEYYRVNQGYPNGEYLLIENRQPLGFDADMPQGGLAIWHIDENTSDTAEGYPDQGSWPSNGNHYRVALLQADGDFDLERGNNRGDGSDVWHGGSGGISEINGTTSPNTDAYQGGIVTETGNRIFNISASGTVMTFDFDDGITPVDPPAAPSITMADHDGFGTVELAWTNVDSEDGYRIYRDGVEIDSVAANVTTYSDGGLAQGLYGYEVGAFNSGGENISLAVNVDVVLPPIAYPSGEANTYGTVSGSYLDLDGQSSGQTLTESESGGKKQNRTSRLEHDWWLDGVNPEGQPSVMVTVEASAPSNSENDDFDFLVSTDGGSSYQPAFTLASNGMSQIVATQLPDNFSGRLYVKVVDSDRGQGNRNLDSVSILEIRAEWSGTVIPAAPSGLTANAVSGSQIDVSWNDGVGEDGYEVQEWNGSSWINAATVGQNATSHSEIGLTEGAPYTYRVCSVFASVVDENFCSNQASATPSTAPATLTASPGKTKGKHVVTLDWTGLTGDVDIFRDGGLIATTSGGSYDDTTGNKGAATYIYEVCETGGGPCTNTVTVVY